MEIEAIYKKSKLPEKPDLTKIYSLLVEIREEYYSITEKIRK